MAERQQNQGPFSDPNRPTPPAGVPESAVQDQGGTSQPGEPAPAQPDQPTYSRQDAPNRQLNEGHPTRQNPEGARPSVFGPNGRYLWFAGGVLFALIGVIAAVLFNLNSPPSVRSDAIKYAAWGMIAGLLIELFLVTFMGGPDGFLSLFGMQGQTASPSGGSVF